MKVIENSPDRLILRSAPWIFGSLLIAAILGVCIAILKQIQADNWDDLFYLALFGLGLPGLCFVFMVRRDELILDRQRGVMELRHRTVFGAERHEIPLERFEYASTQTEYSTSGGGSSKSHRVALILKGPHPKEIRNITPVYGGGPSAENAAKLINQWFKNGTPE